MKWYTGGRSASSSKQARILNRTLHSEGFRCCHRCFEIKPKSTEFFHIKTGKQLNALCKFCASVRAREHIGEAGVFNLAKPEHFERISKWIGGM